jgi:hypothetical protein
MSGDECMEGQMLEAVDDSTDGIGRIGVVAQSFNEPGVVVSFDNMVVTKPEVNAGS